jgi:mono/diheme cytochrome c family protein
VVSRYGISPAAEGTSGCSTDFRQLHARMVHLHHGARLQDTQISGGVSMTPRKSAVLVILAALLLLVLGCDASPRSAAGFRLPKGDPKRGEAVFVEMKCDTCHYVAAYPAGASPKSLTPVRLGGAVSRVRTDGELVTAIIYPSHSLVPGLTNEQVLRGQVSRMPDYGEIMTVRQLCDLVAFLRPRYEVVSAGLSAH